MVSTVVAVFDNYRDAQDAKADLIAIGLTEEAIRITANEPSDPVRDNIVADTEVREDDIPFGQRVADFFSSLFGSDDEEDNASRYSEAVRRGSCVLTVELKEGEETDQADQVTELLRLHDAVDIDHRAQQWLARGWTGYDPSAASWSAEQMDEERQYNTGAATELTPESKGSPLDIPEGSRQLGASGSDERFMDDGTDSDATLPAFEEQLDVGNRKLQKGDVRVVTRASKAARGVDEVVVGKDGRERNETISDIVRRLDDEVEQRNEEDADSDATNSQRGFGGRSQRRDA